MINNRERASALSGRSRAFDHFVYLFTSVRLNLGFKKCKENKEMMTVSRC